MMNYGILTQIYVLWAFNAKETKTSKKNKKKKAKARNAVMSQHNYSIVTTKPQGNLHKFVATSRIVSQQRQSKVQDDCRKIIATLIRT